MDKTLDQHIVEAANDVYAQLGGGLSECIYQAALAIALRQRGYGIETEVVVPILYDNTYVGFVRPDIVINKEVVLELKSVARVVESHLSCSCVPTCAGSHGPRPAARACTAQSWAP